MITRLHLRNFMCHQDTTVSLGPLTVLIGPNDSGKTSLLRAIDLLSRLTRGENVASLEDLVWRKERNAKITWEAEGEASTPFHYMCAFPRTIDHVAESLVVGEQAVFKGKLGDSINYLNSSGTISTPIGPNATVLAELTKYESDRESVGIVSRVAAAMQSSPIYSFSPQEMRSHAEANDHQSTLAPSGANLAAVVSSLLRGPDRDLVNDFESRLHETVPTLRGVSTPVVDSNRFVLEFALAGKSKPPVTIPASGVSDGALYVTAFLALAYGATPGILLIDEPENGLHPSNLKFVIDVLKKISLGEIGNLARQVILTTHSPLLLNYVDAADIRILRRPKGERTEVMQMDQIPNLERLREFAPGELWYLFGEEELVKGPAA